MGVGDYLNSYLDGLFCLCPSQAKSTVLEVGGSQIADQSAEGGFLGFDAGGELELHQGAGEVVLWVVDFEIGVSGQVISEEAQP